MNKHDSNCLMLAGQGAACTCGIAQDPYPPMSALELSRLDAFYATDNSGINAESRRLLANIRELKGRLADRDRQYIAMFQEKTSAIDLLTAQSSELRASRDVPPNTGPPANAYTAPELQAHNKKLSMTDDEVDGIERKLEDESETVSQEDSVCAKCGEPYIASDGLSDDPGGWCAVCLSYWHEWTWREFPRLLGTIRDLQRKLADARTSRDRLMDPVVDPRNSDEPENPNNPDPPVYRGPDVKPQWIPQADTRIGELQPGPPVVESKPIMEAHATTCLAHSHSDTTHNEAMQIARSCAGDDGA